MSISILLIRLRNKFNVISMNSTSYVISKMTKFPVDSPLQKKNERKEKESSGDSVERVHTRKTAQGTHEASHKNATDRKRIGTWEGGKK